MKTQVKLDPRIAHHDILVCDLRGNTLVVSPSRTLLGIDHKVFNSELSRIRELLRSPEIKNLVIDLSHERYFGSEMIGAFFAMAKEVSEDGQAIIVEPSADMRVILDEMSVSSAIPIFDNAEAKIREISDESTLDRIKRHPRLLTGASFLFVTCCCVLIGMTTNLFTPIIGTHESRHLARLMDSFDKTVSIQHKQQAHLLWEKFSNEQNEKFGPYITEVGQVQDKSKLEEALYQATLDVWSMSLSKKIPSRERLEKAHKSLSQTSELIQAEQGVLIEVPNLTDIPEPKLNPTLSAGEIRFSKL